jgi:hypothetical protein
MEVWPDFSLATLIIVGVQPPYNFMGGQMEPYRRAEECLANNAAEVWEGPYLIIGRGPGPLRIVGDYCPGPTIIRGKIIVGAPKIDYCRGRG